MKQYIILFGVLISCIPTFSQFLWSNQTFPTGNGGGFVIEDISSDPFGNTYAFGKSGGSIIIGSDTGGISVLDAELVLIKYDATGQEVWARNIIGKNSNNARTLATDGQGNIYICGQYEQTNQNTILEFGNGVTLNGNASESLFLSKVDSAGHFLWAKSIIATDEPGSQYLRPRDMVINGNQIYISGAVLEAVSIDNQVFNQNNSGHRQMFITSFDTAGNFNWFKHTSKTGRFGFAEGMKMRVAPNNSIYIFGEKADSLSWDGNALPDHSLPGRSGDFLARFNSTGEMSWMKAFTTSGNVDQDYFPLDTDSDGNAVISIRTAGSTVTDDTTYFAEVGSYLVGYDPDGNRRFTRKALSGGVGINGFAIFNLAITPDNRIYGMGQYGLNEVYVGNDTLPAPALFAEGFFTVAYSQSGNILGGRSLMDGYLNSGGTFTTLDLKSTYADDNGHIVLASSFEGQAYAGLDTLDSRGFIDQSFVLKFNPDAYLDISIHLDPRQEYSAEIFPIPVRDRLELNIDPLLEAKEINIFNFSGQLILQQQVNNSRTSLSLSTYPAGYYILWIKGEKGSIRKKIQKF
ncbi:MAG: T9SS type A sorting domain-containing protein [Bacteroidota bacterium]